MFSAMRFVRKARVEHFSFNNLCMSKMPAVVSDSVQSCIANAPKVHLYLFYELRDGSVRGGGPHTQTSTNV